MMSVERKSLDAWERSKGLDCPAFESLFAQCESGSISDSLLHHLDAGCRNCLARLAMAEDMVGLLREAPNDPVPGHLHAAAAGIPHRTRSTPSLVGEVQARGGGSEDVDPIRGAPVGGSLLYRVGNYDVDVSRSNGGALVGQVLSRGEQAPSFEGWYAMLYGGSAPETSSITSNGEFRFTSVAGGEYVLIIEGGEQRLILPELTVDD